MGLRCGRSRLRRLTSARPSLTACRCSTGRCPTPAIRLPGALHEPFRAHLACYHVWQGRATSGAVVMTRRLSCHDSHGGLRLRTSNAEPSRAKSCQQPADFMSVLRKATMRSVGVSTGRRPSCRQLRGRCSNRGPPRLQCCPPHRRRSGMTSWRCGSPWRQALPRVPSCSRLPNGAPLPMTAHHLPTLPAAAPCTAADTPCNN